MVINLQQASAFTISLDSPDSTRIDEEFRVKIKADTNEIQDVKIFVHKSDEEKIPRSDYISEIYDDGWEDSWYYLKEIFPDEKEFKIKVTKSPGKRQICARLRNTETKSTVTECNKIKIEDDEEDSELDEEPFEEETEQPLIKTETQNQQVQQEKIILNSPQQESKTPDNEVFITKTEKTRLWIIYSFTFLCVIIIFLLALKKL